MTNFGWFPFIFVSSALASVALILLLRPLLMDYAVARPGPRSSHRSPTPQGGGIAVILATIIAVIGAALFSPGALTDPGQLSVVLASTVGLAIVGVTDDIRPFEALPRLLLQGAAVAAVAATLPVELRIIPILPWWFERVCVLIGCVWFVNVVNFMDGIDWLTVAEIVPLTAGLTLLGFLGFLPVNATLVALALCGAMIGFAPFNRPTAQLFLGDVGSLPIGLLLGWLLVLLAGGGHFAAAALLPLYYVADATLTLLQRVAKGESVMQAHRKHFYQRAYDGGLGAYQIVGSVVLLNVALFGLASATLFSASRLLHAAALLAGCILVGLLLYRFDRVGRTRRT